MDNCQNIHQTTCKKKFIPIEMLWIELIMFFQPERNIKHVKEQERSNTKYFLELKFQGKL